MLPKEARLVNSVFVKTDDWNAGGELICYFLVAACLDMSSEQRVKRSRLRNPSISVARPDCEAGVMYEVTQCDVA